jgi:hypothetical protein
VASAVIAEPAVADPAADPGSAEPLEPFARSSARDVPKPPCIRSVGAADPLPLALPLPASVSAPGSGSDLHAIAAAGSNTIVQHVRMTDI